MRCFAGCRIGILCLVLSLTTGVSASLRTELMDSVTVLRGADDFATAAARLQAWVAGHPADGDAHLLLGQILADGGDGTAAERVWSNLLQGRAVDVERYRDVARRLQALGRIEAAQQTLQEGAERLGGSDPFAWQRAELLLANGDFRGAVAAHRTFLRQEPHRRPLVENRIAAMAGADVAAGSTKSSRALQYCTALATATNGAPERERTTLVLLQASCWLATGDAAAGLQVLLDAEPGDDTVLQALFQYGTRSEASGNADVAARAYGAFARHAPGSPYLSQARRKEAQMLALAGDTDAALSRYVELSAGNSSDAIDALLHVAELQAQVFGDPAAALATLEIPGATILNAELQARLLALRADCRLRLDDLDGAAAEWRRLVDDPARRGDAEFGLAEIAFFAAHFDSAAAFIDSLVLRQPTHALANDALALLLLIDEFAAEGNALAVFARARLRERQGRTDEARRERAWLRRQAPAGLRHVSLLESAALMEQDTPTAALELYAQVTADQPEERHAVSAALGRARLQEASGQPQEALRTYESAVLQAPLDPRTPDIRRHIARLRALLGGTG